MIGSHPHRRSSLKPSRSPWTPAQESALAQLQEIRDRRPGHVAAPRPLLPSPGKAPPEPLWGTSRDISTQFVPQFVPGSGNIGGGLSGFGSFVSGMGRLGQEVGGYTIAPGAFVDPRFAQGTPGTYVLTMTLENVQTSVPKRPFLDAKPWNDALRAQGIDADVTAVKWTKSSEAHDSNWAGSLLTDIFGGDVNTNVVQDLTFEVTVRVFGSQAQASTPANSRVSLPYGSDYSTPEAASGDGMSGLGVVQLGAGAVFAIVAVVAIVLAATFPGFGKIVLSGVKFVGEAAGAAVGGAARAVADNALPILVAVGVAAAAIFLLKKGGAKYSKGGGFSFGG